MDARQQVDVLIARDACSVVPPVAELEEAHGVKGELGRVAQITLPVDRLGRGVRRDGIFPGADGVGPVNLALDVVDGPDLATVNPLLSFVRRLHAQALAADLDRASRVVGYLDLFLRL